MDKLQKVYKLTDESTGLQIAGLCREQLEPLECSSTIIEQGYFITKEQLVEYANYFLDSAFEEKFSLAEDDSEVINYLKQLGVE